MHRQDWSGIGGAIHRGRMLTFVSSIQSVLLHLVINKLDTDICNIRLSQRSPTCNCALQGHEIEFLRFLFLSIVFMLLLNKFFLGGVINQLDFTYKNWDIKECFLFYIL